MISRQETSRGRRARRKNGEPAWPWKAFSLVALRLLPNVPPGGLHAGVSYQVINGGLLKLKEGVR